MLQTSTKPASQLEDEFTEEKAKDQKAKEAKKSPLERLSAAYKNHGVIDPEILLEVLGAKPEDEGE